MNTQLIFFTKRELEILKMIMNDQTSREIAHALYISIETVKSHRKNMSQKLSVKTTGGLIGKCFELGILGKRVYGGEELRFEMWR